MSLKAQIVKDALGNKAAVLPDIIFKNRKQMEWVEVEKYLQRYVGQAVTVTEREDIIHIGINFPDEYKGSRYTRC